MSSFSHQHLHLDTEGDDTCQPLSPYSFKESSKSQDAHSSSSGISGHGWEHMKRDKTKCSLLKSYSGTQTQTGNEQRGLGRCKTAQSHLDVQTLRGERK